MGATGPDLRQCPLQGGPTSSSGGGVQGVQGEGPALLLPLNQDEVSRPLFGQAESTVQAEKSLWLEGLAHQEDGW